MMNSSSRLFLRLFILQKEFFFGLLSNDYVDLLEKDFLSFSSDCVFEKKFFLYNMMSFSLRLYIHGCNNVY